MLSPLNKAFYTLYIGSMDVNAPRYVMVKINDQNYQPIITLDVTKSFILCSFRLNTFLEKPQP